MKPCVLVVIAATVLCASPEKCYPWWSLNINGVENTSHYRLSEEAIGIVDPLEYPDVSEAWYSSLTLKLWTTLPSNDNNAHGYRYDTDAGKYDGGPIVRWWGASDSAQFPEYPQDGVLAQYGRLNILGNETGGQYSAYYYLALMAHLVEDQAVPAHAANIKHDAHFGIDDPYDNYEARADFLIPAGSYEPKPPLQDMSAPYTYYESPPDGCLETTQRKNETWRYTGDSIYNNWLFWQNHDGYVGSPFAHPLGSYGFPPNRDIYPALGDDGDEQNRIITGQFSQAIRYTAGFLMAASKKLPPLVEDFHLNNAPIQSSGADVVFYIHENRTPFVTVTIKIVSSSVLKGYLAEESGAVWKDKRIDLINGALLPWSGDTYISAWRGKISDGSVASYLSNGQFTMRVEVTDGDGNEVNTVYPNINSDGFSDNDTEKAFEVLMPLPPAVNGLHSDNHTDIYTWNDPQSRNKTVQVSWTVPTVSVGLPIDGYSYVWDNNPNTMPPATKMAEAATTTMAFDRPDGTSNYFHIRTVDAGGNWSEDVAEIGAFYIDTAGPRILSTFP